MAFETALDHIWIPKYERVEKFLGGRNPASARLTEVVPFFGRIINALQEKMDESAIILNKVKKY